MSHMNESTQKHDPSVLLESVCLYSVTRAQYKDIQIIPFVVNYWSKILKILSQRQSSSQSYRLRQ